MRQYGIWSDAAGGFVEDALYDEITKRRALAKHQKDDPGARVERVCDLHQDETYDGCSRCLR